MVSQPKSQGAIRGNSDPSECVQAAVPGQLAENPGDGGIVVHLHHVGQFFVPLRGFLLQRHGVRQKSVQVGHALRQFHILSSSSKAAAAAGAGAPGRNTGISPR
jgi:hypothetical protein